MSVGFFPDDYIDSIYDVDFVKLYDEGYRAVLFDVDNTLVPHNAPADERAKDFFKYLRDTGFRTMMISNNSEPRVRDFCGAVNGDGYLYKAGKPSTSSYERAMSILGTDTTNTIFCGDQIFTDIWGANRTGIRSIMVRPVLKWHEEPQIVLKRILEAVVLLFYNAKKAPRPVPIRSDKGEDL